METVKRSVVSSSTRDKPADDMQAHEVGVDSRPDVRTHLARLGLCAVYLAPSGLGPGGFMSPTVLVALRPVVVPSACEVVKQIRQNWLPL